MASEKTRGKRQKVQDASKVHCLEVHLRKSCFFFFPPLRKMSAACLQLAALPVFGILSSVYTEGGFNMPGFTVSFVFLLHQYFPDVLPQPQRAFSASFTCFSSRSGSLHALLLPLPFSCSWALQHLRACPPWSIQVLSWTPDPSELWQVAVISIFMLHHKNTVFP